MREESRGDELAVVYPQLSEHLQRRADDLLRRAVSAMGDHVLTWDLELAVDGLSRVIREAGRIGTAQMLERANSELGASMGQLASRATRVKADG